MIRKKLLDELTIYRDVDNYINVAYEDNPICALKVSLYRHSVSTSLISIFRLNRARKVLEIK